MLICPYYLWRELTHVKIWMLCMTDSPNKIYLGQLLPVLIDLAAVDCKTVVFGRFRKAGSAVSVILECEAREPHTRASLAVFSLAPDLSFEYGPSLAFAKNTTVLQSIFTDTSKTPRSGTQRTLLRYSLSQISINLP